MMYGEFPLKDEGVTLNDLIASYLTYCAARNTPRTISLKRTYLRRFADYIGEIPIRNIKRALVEDFISHRAAKGNNPANNRTLTVLKNFFNFIIAREILEINPVVGVKKFPEARRPIKLLSEKELKTYFDYCRNADPFLYDVSAIAYNTGLRRGDILKIEGTDVDAERRVLTVRVSKLSGELVLYIPLNANALEVLERRKRDHGNGFLFPGRNVPHVVDFKRRFAREKKATGIDFLFMEFRHNCATTLLRKGVDIYTVKEVLGHANISTTARYLGLTDQQKRDALNKLTGDF
jgi:site-specific recombinase XerD